jgi:hypothetical protein
MNEEALAHWGCCARRKKKILTMLNLAADNKIAWSAGGKTGRLH